MIRLFAALLVPPLIAEGLLLRQTGLFGARWRPQDALHITLRFFGEVREDIAADLSRELEVVSASPLALNLVGVGAFGDGLDIHAVWAGVEPNPGLVHLANACEGAARRAGLAAGKRAYRPHLTLAYLRRPNPEAVAHWIQENNLLHSQTFAPTSFGLYSSHITDEGSRYRLERTYPLV